MIPGVRVRTDDETFDRWADHLPALALPPELRCAAVAAVGKTAERPGSGPATGIAVPPVVAASLAVHGCADVAVLVRVLLPSGEVVGCFSAAGELAAGLVRSAQGVEVGLHTVADLVPEIVRLVPDAPPCHRPMPLGGCSVGIAVLAADSAVTGWRHLLVCAASGDGLGTCWRAEPPTDGDRPVVDARQNLAADLRFVLAECLDTAADGGRAG